MRWAVEARPSAALFRVRDMSSRIRPSLRPCKLSRNSRAEPSLSVVRQLFDGPPHTYVYVPPDPYSAHHCPPLLASVPLPRPPYTRSISNVVVRSNNT